jgi:predicted transcriptional regulator
MKTIKNQQCAVGAKTDFAQVFILLQNLLNIVYNIAMTTKEIALKTIEQLPTNASWEDIQERINFVVAVRKGLRELDEGKGIPHDKVKEEFAEWLTD